ncbi:putative aldehyde dehydrogenase [Penicillium argentinense]|uniref:aldehyde dehydrogenase (NAD(+)) n=1 Tax=Penicillium argentinense TaxID=1131581 RepID=A0A9W9KME2_9EURO|nr:putative aldehyde dehydrogenase [Penicillium argentinense]KAJ5110848.1 putative aldehyde dehydrogenase [Penicillium argentinense]
MMGTSVAGLNFDKFYNIVNGETVSSAVTQHGTDPANKKPNPPVPVASPTDLDNAVTAAQVAFEQWSRFQLEDRRKALFAYSDAVNAEKDGFISLLTKEQGKPLSQAAVEVEMAVAWIKGLANLEIPEIVLEDSSERRIVQRFTPIGVAAAIVPWNFPVLLAIGKVVSALVTGNSIIVKPSPFTPYTALKLAELAIPFFPPGLFQALNGDDQLGPWMTRHPGIQKISFTGSTLTGKRVAVACADSFKHCTLELGGNDPAIICKDVDLDALVPKIAPLCFLNSSQVCMMIKRVYVHESIYGAFRDRLAAHVKTLLVGNGVQPDVFFGPVQNEMQYNKALDLLSSISAEGLRPALGGIVEESAGYFIHPTIIDNPPDTSRVVIEEAFAPILPLMKWQTEEEVIARANAGPTGLGGSVWSRDLDQAERLASRLECGSVWINSHFAVAPHVPFGGRKESGHGVEWGVDGLKAYCNPKTVWIFKNA